MCASEDCIHTSRRARTDVVSGSEPLVGEWWERDRHAWWRSDVMPVLLEPVCLPGWLHTEAQRVGVVVRRRVASWRRVIMRMWRPTISGSCASSSPM